MNRTSILSFFVVAGATAVLFAGTAQSQSGVPKNQVILQPTTPGTSQSGHLNVSGTARAGQFVGGGAGVTGVNANLLDGIDSTAFLQAIPTPLNLSGTANGTGVISGTNSSNSSLSAGVRGVTNSSLGIGVYGVSTLSTGSNYGGYFENFSANGWAIIAKNANAAGTQASIQGEAGGTSNAGVFGIATNSSGANFGVRGSSNSNSGIGVYGLSVGIGLKGESTNGNAGVLGISSGTAIRGDTSGTTARAVYGNATATTGQNFGVFGSTDSDVGTGIRGQASNTTPAGIPVGVLGSCPTTSSGHGVGALGDFFASGTKSFRIDHPSDPENKYLVHYCSESPFPQNTYNGNVLTDEKGFAWVELPEYFAEINTNFKYQLTVVSSGEDFVHAMVSKKIDGNRFQIRTSAPRTEVSWQINADRNDARVKTRRPVDVQEKTGIERGTYLHPEYFGQPESMGTYYQPRSTQSSKPGTRINGR